MIWREGGCSDELHDFVWVRLEYDEKRNRSWVWIWDRKGGRVLASGECTGLLAERFYDRLNVYFFGYE